MKASWATLNIPKWKVSFARPISTRVQHHEMLPPGVRGVAMRVSMDLDSARREWADSSQHVVEAAKKYVGLYDQYLGWLHRREASGNRERGACASVWKDMDGCVVASACEEFEHMMNQYTMGMMCAYVGDAASSKAHFEAARHAAACVPCVRGTQRVRYNVHCVPLVGELLARAQGVRTLLTLSESADRKALALELLEDFPMFPEACVWHEYASTVRSVVLEHAMRAEMHGLCSEDRFAEARVYACLLSDDSSRRFLESMALTARQPLLDSVEYLNSLGEVSAAAVYPEIVAGPGGHPAEVPGTLATAHYLGFDAVAV